MITFQCCQCHEDHTEETPHMWGECYPYFEGTPACKSCVDNYNGPDDDNYQNLQESALSYNQKMDMDYENSRDKKACRKKDEAFLGRNNEFSK